MKEKIDERAIYAGLWKCRDFEIDHVWQRAVFLSAFLLACYAGYGGMILGLVTADHIRVSMRVMNLLGFGIAVIGLLLSLVWIMMAKGSKAWYEHYEAAIGAFEKNHYDAFEFKHGARVQSADATIKGFIKPATSSWLWNTQGGAFSVAKINIVIGHISTLVWLVIAVVHIAFALRFKTWAEFENRIMQCDLPRCMICGLIMTLLLFWLYSLVEIKSSFLTDCKKKD